MSSRVATLLVSMHRKCHRHRRKRHWSAEAIPPVAVTDMTAGRSHGPLGLDMILSVSCNALGSAWFRISSLEDTEAENLWNQNFAKVGGIAKSVIAVAKKEKITPKGIQGDWSKAEKREIFGKQVRHAY